MRSPTSVQTLTDLGRTRLSRHFFLREFLHSEVGEIHGIPNIPENPALAIAAGTRLATDLLEPLVAAFGPIVIRSGYRAPRLNALCNEMQRAGKPGYSCGSNEMNRAGHIWDLRDREGRMGATVSIVIPWLIDRPDPDWRAMAWWIHDHLPYHALYFFPKNLAFNLTWREAPERRISSHVAPKGRLTEPGMENHEGTHAEYYHGYPPGP